MIAQRPRPGLEGSPIDSPSACRSHPGGALLGLAAAFLLSCGTGTDAPAPNPGPPPAPTPQASPDPPSPPEPSPPQPTAGPQACRATDAPALGGELRLETWREETFERPVAMVQAPGGSSDWYIVEQKGVIRRIENSSAEMESSIALDWRDRVVDPIETESWETGLLGLAFHPGYPQDRRAFAYATFSGTEPGACPRIVVAELVEQAGAFNPEPRRILLDQERRCRFTSETTFESGHNAGTMHFDPQTGRLVVGIGDLSRKDRAQDPDSIDGTLLQIDVDRELDAGEETLPGLNAPAEVLAWGFRNPWKWSFDRTTGEIWVGDVGLHRREEINRVEPGQNYGWPIWEGELCNTAEPCEADGFARPLLTYPHGTGCSVTGGYVYRGAKIPELYGRYLFSDWCSGLVWALFEGDEGLEPKLIADHAGPIVSFAEDNDGELFVLDHNGSILQIAGFQLAEHPDFPTRLSETTCVDPEDPTQPALHLIPYDVNVPFWSAGADKRRWISLPPGETIWVGEDGEFHLPAGTVLVKEFALDGQRIETRLMMHHQGVGWRGYSYAWEGDDATLVSPFGQDHALADGRTWKIPGRQECSRCHTERAGYTLGLELAQIGRGSREDTGDPLEALIDRGLFDAASLSQASELRFPSATTPATPDNLAEAARAYLHVNCASCHRPGSQTYFVPMDLRASIPLAETGLCDVSPSRPFPGEDMRLIAPGDPEKSVLLQRMQHPDDMRMPPLSNLELDEEGVTLITDWILSLRNCPTDLATASQRREPRATLADDVLCPGQPGTTN